MSLHHHTCFAMHTRFSMVLIGVSEEQAASLSQSAEHQLHQLEFLMSRFHPSGPLSEINNHAAQTPVTPPEELWQLLQICRQAWQQTNGAFDITLRPLQELWHQAQANQTEPTEAQLAHTRQQTGFDKLQFDDNARTIAFTAPGLTLDLGAIGKGYALDQITQTLRAEGVTQAFLSFGESSITVLGSHPNGPHWPVAIPNPFHPDEILHTFPLKDASLSTSGALPANQHQSLILDPKTACPIPGPRTLSVASQSATQAEVFSTALLVTPIEARSNLLANYPNIQAAEIVYYSHEAQNENEFIPNIVWTHPAPHGT